MRDLEQLVADRTEVKVGGKWHPVMDRKVDPRDVEAFRVPETIVVHPRSTELESEVYVEEK